MFKKWLLFFVFITGFAGLLAAQNSNVFVTRAELRDGQKWLVITGYTGNEKTVTIPASIDGVPVRKIGDMAFRLKGLTDIALPQGLEVIGNQAFFGNQLSIVVIPASVRIISDSAFDSNMLKKITNADLTESSKNQVKSNVYYVAADKQHLSVELFDKASKLYGSFYNPLTGYDGKFKPVSGSNGIPAVPKDAKDTPSKEIGIKKYGASSVKGYALSVYREPVVKNMSADVVSSPIPQTPAGSDIYSHVYIELPGDYTGISAIPVLDSKTVSKNSDLTVNRVKPVNAKQSAADKIKNNNVSSSNAEMGIGKFAYKNKGLDSVVIPEGTTFIGEGAYASNNLSSIVIPASVRSIGSQAFIGNNLGDITIGENVKVQSDSFRYQFSDYYRMNNYKAGTYVLKAGHWNLSGQERPPKYMH
jgi:hypothetical protein